MSSEKRLQYHTDRAMQELNQGLAAGSIAAARAHLGLSALHMKEVRSLGGGPDRPPLIMD